MEARACSVRADAHAGRHARGQPSSLLPLLCTQAHGHSPASASASARVVHLETALGQSRALLAAALDNLDRAANTSDGGAATNSLEAIPGPLLLLPSAAPAVDAPVDRAATSSGGGGHQQAPGPLLPSAAAAPAVEHVVAHDGAAAACTGGWGRASATTSSGGTPLLSAATAALGHAGHAASAGGGEQQHVPGVPLLS
jgi:hypothetical protein